MGIAVLVLSAWLRRNQRWKLVLSATMRLRDAMADGEVLLVGGYSAAASGGRVVARVEPDIVVVEADAEHLSVLARSARFAVSRDPEAGTQTYGDERVLDDLDASAQLFVRAWRERPLDKPDRPGEGQSWGATGFAPPDLPSQS